MYGGAVCSAGRPQCQRSQGVTLRIEARNGGRQLYYAVAFAARAVFAISGHDMRSSSSPDTMNRRPSFANASTSASRSRFHG